MAVVAANGINEIANQQAKSISNSGRKKKKKKKKNSGISE